MEIVMKINNINNSKYTLWMNSILRRSKEIGKVELPICSIILDERGRCIGRGVNRRNINKDPLGHAEIMALKQASLIKMIGYLMNVLLSQI